MSSHKAPPDDDPTPIPQHKSVNITQLRIPISIYVATIVCVIGWTFVSVQAFFSIKSDLKELKEHVTHDWTLADQRLWAATVMRLNSNVVSPDPDAVWQTVHRNP